MLSSCQPGDTTEQLPLHSSVVQHGYAQLADVCMSHTLENTHSHRHRWLHVSMAPCGLRGCKNRAHSVSWPKVIKDIPNQGVDCLLARAVFSVSLLCLGCMWCFVLNIAFGCQYQCNRFPGKTRLWNDLLCVEWDVKPYTLTHSLTHVFPDVI